MFPRNSEKASKYQGREGKENLSFIERKTGGLECDLTKSKVHEVHRVNSAYGPHAQKVWRWILHPSSFVIADLSFYWL